MSLGGRAYVLHSAWQYKLTLLIYDVRTIGNSILDFLCNVLLLVSEIHMLNPIFVYFRLEKIEPYKGEVLGIFGFKVKCMTGL